MMRANMAGVARPVRMAANSSLAWSTARSIFSSASKRVSSIISSASFGAVVNRAGRAFGGMGSTKVPILSPRSAWRMVSSPSAAKTSIGRPFSWQRLNAAASTTLSPRRSASSKVTMSNLRAVGSVRGSAV